MFGKLFRHNPAKAAGARLYASAVTQARSPVFYRDLSVPDRIDARFELYALHVILLVHRLAGCGEQASQTSQGLFDSFVSALDHTLRELGVGDLSVAKKIRPLGEAFYGRTRAYAAALKDGGDRNMITGLVARTIFADEAARGAAAPMVDYVIRADQALAACPLEELLAGRVTWIAPLEQAA